MSPVFLLIPILLPIAGGLAMLIRPLKKDVSGRPPFGYSAILSRSTASPAGLR